jgi:hypothetical protein
MGDTSRTLDNLLSPEALEQPNLGTIYGIVGVPPSKPKE